MPLITAISSLKLEVFWWCSCCWFCLFCICSCWASPSYGIIFIKSTMTGAYDNNITLACAEVVRLSPRAWSARKRGRLCPPSRTPRSGFRAFLAFAKRTQLLHYCTLIQHNVTQNNITVKVVSANPKECKCLNCFCLTLKVLSRWIHTLINGSWCWDDSLTGFYLGNIFWGTRVPSGQRPGASWWVGGMPPGICFEMNMCWDAVWCILRHNLAI